MITKATFPYELFSDISQVLGATRFPKYAEFQTSLAHEHEKNAEEFLKIFQTAVNDGRISKIR